MSNYSTGKAGILSELHPFFHPRAIAVVGVSQDPTKFGNVMCRSIQGFGFSGPIYPVSPKVTEFLGLKCYPSVAELPEEVDLACICLSAQHVPGAVKECRAKGIPAVEIVSAGFSEAGTEEGKKLQDELVNLSGNGLRIIGPNCFGVYSPAGGVTHLSGTNYPRESGFLGLISQSGGNAEDYCGLARDYGLRFSQAVSYGNACDISEIELLQYFEADPHTRLVAVYLEGVRKGKEFFDTMLRLAPQKPVIFWKGGLTPSGAKVVTSHTASLSGSEDIWTAMFRQSMAVQVHSLWELLDTTSCFYYLTPQTDQRVALVCGGGGTSVAASDACHRAGLMMPTLSKEVQQKIASFLPPIGSSAHNPIDVGTPFPSGEMLKGVLETLAASKEVGSIIMDKTMPSIRMRHLMGYDYQIGWEEKPWLTRLPVSIQRKWNIPVLMVLREGGDLLGKVSCEVERRRLRRYYQERGIVVFSTVENALSSLGRLVKYYRSIKAI
jgi:acyl-CoA synthetase (NDP forming)